MIRACIPDSDYSRVAELLNLVETNPVTADTIRRWDSRAGFILRRSVSVDDQNRVTGYCVAVHAPWAAAGRFYVWVIVDPAWRGQNIGARLYDDGLRFALESGATFLDSETRDDCPAGLAFARARGFTVDRHIFESVINLADFDENRFAGVVESVQATGIRFFSLADAGDTVEMRCKLWHVNYQTHLDDPASAGTFPSFDEMMDIWAAAEWFVPEGQILAADGDEVIGLAAVGYFAASNSMFNLMTGVMPGYRGRKIAQALKLLSIRFAKTYGAGEIRTTNDSANAAMLAINRKLGYQPQPGIFRLVNDLKAASG